MCPLTSELIKLTDRRLPLRMKTDIVLDALQKNFSRYGTVKYTFHHERNGDSCEKGFVIFAVSPAIPSRTQR